MGQKEELQIYLNRVQSKVAGESDYLNAIQIFADLKNFPRVITLSQQGLENFPDEGIFHYWYAFASFYLKKFEAAFTSVNLAVNNNTEHLDSILLGYRISIESSDPDNALIFLKLGADRFPDESEMHQTIFDFFDNNGEFVSNHVNLITSVYANGEKRLGKFLLDTFYSGKITTEQALDVYIENFSQKSDDKDFSRFVCSIIIKDERTDKPALSVLQGVYDSGNKSKAVVGYLSDVSAAKGAWGDENQILYEHAVELNCATYSVFKLLANKYILLQLKDENSLDVIFQYFLFEPDNKDTITYLIPFVLKKKTYTEDEKNFLKIAFRLFPDNFDIFAKLVENMLFDVNEVIDNLTFLQRYIEEFPQSEAAIKLLGSAYLKLGRKDSEALFIYEKFVRFNSDSLELISILTEYYLSENRRSRLAIIIYEKAFQMGLTSKGLFGILALYYLDNQSITDSNIPIFISVFNNLRKDPQPYSNFLNTLSGAILKKKITITENEFFFESLKDIIKILQPQEDIFYSAFVKLGISLHKIDNDSFEIYKRLIAKFKASKKFLMLLFDAYSSRNVVDEEGRSVMEAIYEKLSESDKQKATLLLSQYYMDNKIKDDFAGGIISKANSLIKDGVKLEGNLEKLVQYAVKNEKKDSETLELYFRYLQINQENPAVFRSACELIVDKAIFEKKFLSIMKKGMELFDDWRELFNHYAVALAKNKIRESDSYPIWERFILSGNKDDSIVIELLSHYINKGTLDRKAERVFSFAMGIGYKNAEILLQYSRILAKDGNYNKLINVISDLIKFDIKEVEDIKFIADTLLFYAKFDVLEKFLGKYSDKSEFILRYKLRNLFYSNKLSDNEECLQRFVSKYKIRDNNADIYEFYGDFYFYEKRDLKKAIHGYGEYLRMSPNDALILYKATICVLEIGDTYSALKYVKKLLLFREHDIEAQKIAANIHFKLGQYPEASGFYKRIISVGYKDTEILKNYALALFFSQQYYSAIDLFREILTDDPNNQELLLNLAYAYTYIDFKEEAEDTLRKIIDNNPQNKEALFALFAIYLEDVRADEHAEGLFNLVLKMDPENLDALKMLSMIYGKLGRNDERAISIYVKILDYGEPPPEIIKILANKLNEEGSGLHGQFRIKIFSRAVEFFPSNEKYWVSLIDLISEELELEPFTKILEAAYEKKIRISVCAEKLAKLAYDKGEIDKALIYAKTVLAHNPYKSEIYNLVGEILIEKGSLEEAKDVLNNALIYDSGNFYAYLNSAKVMHLMKNFPLALKYLERSLNINKYYLPGILLYAEISVERNINLDNAKNALKFVKDIYQSNWEISYWLAVINNLKGDSELALMQIDEALGFELNLESVLLKAEILKQDGKYQEALDFLNQQKDDINAPELFNALGQLYFDLDDIESSKEAYSLAVSIDPNFIQTQIALAKLHYSVDKDLETAKVEFMNILEFNAENEEAQRFLGKIHYRKKEYKEALKVYMRVFEYLDYEDLKYLTSIYFMRGLFDEVLELAANLIQQRSDDLDVVTILFETYCALQLYDKAIDAFQTLRINDSERAQEYFEKYFGILISSGNYKKLREELQELIKDQRYGAKYAEYFFFLEYILFNTKFEDIKFLLKFLLDKKQDKIDFKKNRDLMLFHILLQENAFSSIDTFIHIFNKEDDTIRFLTAMYYVKSGKEKGAMNLLKSFHEYWSRPYFTPFLSYSKKIFVHLKERYRFNRIWEMLANQDIRDEKDYWYKIFLKYAEEKLGEKFLEKDKIDKGLHTLHSRLERYELAKGKKDSDLNSDLFLKMYQLYFFLEGDFKECQKIAKKNDQLPGLLFSKDLFTELAKRKTDSKKIMSLVSKELLIDEVPYFIDFLYEYKIPELAKMTILGADKKKLTEHHSEILYNLYERGLLETNKEIEAILSNSRSCNARFLLRNGRYEEAYKTVMEMNYLEFTSPGNCNSVMEAMRVNEDYDQLLTYRFRYIDPSFANDNTNLYSAIALSKFSFEERAHTLLSGIQFDNIEFLNATRDIATENQYPGKQRIENFLSTSPHPKQILELFDLLKDYDRDLLKQFDGSLKEMLPEPMYLQLQGRVIFIEGDMTGALDKLKDSEDYEDLKLIVSLSSGMEAKDIIEKMVAIVNKKKEYYEQYITFLPFSFKEVFLHAARDDLFSLKTQLFELFANLHDLEGKLTVGKELVKFDPTQIYIYKEIFYILRDFKQDYVGSLKILNKMLSLNPKDADLILEKGKLLIQEGREEYALNFLLENKGLSSKILSYIGEINEKRKRPADAIEIYEQLFEATEDLMYYEKVIQLKYSLELYSEILETNEKDRRKSDLINYYLGMSLFHLKEYKKANEFLSSIKSPKFPHKDDVVVTMGLIFFNLGDFQRSQSFLEKAIKNKKREDIAWAKFAEILYSKKNIQKAEKTLETAIAKGYTDPSIHLLGAEIYFTMNNKQKLVKQLRILSGATLPDTVQNHLRYGIILHKTGKEEKAESEFLRIIENLQPDNPTALKYLIDIYLKQEAYTRCLPLVTRAFKKEPRGNAFTYASVLYAMGRFDEAREIARNINSDTMEVERFKGKLYYELKSYDEALARFNAILEKEPKDFEAYLYIGKIYYSLFDIPKAIEFLKIAENLDENDFEVLKFLGLAYNKMSDTINTIIFLKKALSLNAKDHETIRELAQLYYSKKRYKEAIKEFSRVIAVKFNLPSVHFQMAKAYRYLGDYDNAEIHVNNALEFTPAEEVFIEEKINILQNLERHSDIVTTLQDFSKNASLDAKLVLTMVESLRKLNRFTAALKIAENYKIPEMAANDFKKEKAILLYQLKKYDEALPLLEELHKNSDSDEVFIILCFTLIEMKNTQRLRTLVKNYKGELLKSEYIPYIRGFIEINDGNKEIALNYFYQSITMNKAFVPAYRRLSDIYIQNSNYVMAIDILHKALTYEDTKKNDLYYFLGYSYLQLNDLFNALKYIKEALKWDYLNSAELTAEIYKALGLFGYGLISMKKLWMEERVNSAFAWKSIIYCLFKLNRDRDAVIESFYNLVDIDSDILIIEFAKTLLHKDKKPYAAYEVIKDRIDKDKPNIELLYLYLSAVGEVNLDVDISAMINWIKEITDKEQNPKLLEAMGIYYYKKGNYISSSAYLQKAITVNPDSDTAIYYLSLLK